MKRDKVVFVHRGSCLSDGELVDAFKGIGGHPVVEGVLEICRRAEDGYMDLAMGQKIDPVHAVEKIEAVRTVMEEVLALVEAGKAE